MRYIISETRGGANNHVIPLLIVEAASLREAWSKASEPVKNWFWGLYEEEDDPRRKILGITVKNEPDEFIPTTLYHGRFEMEAELNGGRADTRLFAVEVPELERV